ncbi:aspartic peptidase domain-containing protein [Obelidium mucronatum]|nr:aspartic peptidase domain-containing protein [Obelidium mucronatum]
MAGTTSSQQGLTGGPLITGCYNIDIHVSGIKFNVQIDSGSSDLLIPGSTLQAYTGPTYSTAGKIPITSQTVGAGFMDGSSWSGLFYMDEVGIDDNAVKVQAPFAVMRQQTSNPTVTDGSTSQGLLGLAYDSLSTVHSLNLPSNMKNIPYTLMTALTRNHAIASDIIAFRSCPGGTSTPSLVDWGVSDPSLTCTPAGSLLWAAVISDTYYSVNVTSISVGSVPLQLGKTWQKSDESIFDSCTTILLLPTFAYTILANKLINSGGFPKNFGSNNIDLFINQGYGFSNLILDYTKMPDLTFTILAEDRVSKIELVIPPQGYIEKDDNGYLYFTVGSHDSNNVVFGGTVFNDFYIVLDRGGRRVGLGLGCDCEK